MTERYLKVEGYAELVRDTDSGAIINRNTTAYMKARSRSIEVQKRNDELRNANIKESITDYINIKQITSIKCKLLNVYILCMVCSGDTINF